MSKAVEQAYEWIRGKILSGEYAEGSHLIEECIAAESKVSRTPVREALRRLSSEHFVTFAPNQGASVASWEASDIKVIFELRAMLEGYSAYRAATRITDAAIKEMELFASKIEALCVEHTIENHRSTIYYNRQFHSTFIEAANSERINKLLASVVEIPMMLKTIDRFSVSDMERSNYHHRELIEAFNARDREWARNVMESHLRGAHRSYLRMEQNLASRDKTSTKTAKTEER